MSKITTLRGMNDLPPKEVRVWDSAEETIKKVFLSYGYEEIRFPIIEKSELFTRSNESADIVTKEMYSFKDKSGDSISLRPEGTAGCVRAAIDNDLIRVDSPRLWYQGPMFRYERPQKGRSRQFHQSSAEVFGIRSAEIDAELIILSARIWKELGIEENINLEINNLGDEKTRKSYAKSLQDYFKAYKNDFDDDSKRKLDENPLRILDSKSDFIQGLLNDAPKISEFISQDSQNEFNELTDLLKVADVKFSINQKLVRGLDYYNQTVYEWKTGLLGAQDTVCGGGRYDNLVEELGGKPCPATGFSIGMERLILLIKASSELNLDNSKLDLFFVCLSKEGIQKAIMYTESLRERVTNLNVRINMGLEGVGSQFKKADKSGAKFALVLGDDELKNNTISIKDLRTKSDQETFSYEDLEKRIEKTYK
jgi:histidyl-tRNA synthetase|tara:strand:- start:2365 stop:3636 length:1272 start_codon:yes stop_codon:yes gene_type:complete